MRTHGAETKINCWKVKVIANNVVLLNNEYPSLRKIGEALGLSRNIINEIVNNRRKQRSGKFDTQYIITKLEPEPENLAG